MHTFPPPLALRFLISCTFLFGMRDCVAEVPVFIQQHCADCHDGGESEGGFEFTQLNGPLADEAVFAKWERVFDRTEQHEMPPADAVQPSQAERDVFLDELRKPLAEAHAKEKATVFRRLNRQEYENTVNDLFGTHLDLIDRLPEDGRADEFDNVGAALNLSSIQLDAYLQTAELILDEAIEKHLEKPSIETIRANYADMRGAEKFLGNQWLHRDDGAVVFFQRLGYPSGMLREASPRRAGWYDVSVTGYAFQSDEPVTFSIEATTFARGAEKQHYGFRQFLPGDPQTVTLRAWIPERYMIELTPWGIYDPDYLIKKNGISAYSRPGLAIQHVELRGPIVETFPSRGHQLLFAELPRTEIVPRNPADRKKSWYVPKFEIQEGAETSSSVDQTLIRVATALYRRPVGPTEITAYRKLFDAEHDSGESIESALRTAVSAMLCSTDFLFFSESGPWLDHHAIANRLSYFLNRSCPDAELRAAADSGKLATDPELLKQQTQRLLLHPHASRFINDYCDAWLGLRDLDFTTPDAKLFPEYDVYLKSSMRDETRAFLSHMISNNLPIRNLIRSDFAMLNERLARHYGIEGVDGPEIRPVKLPADSLRGGVLSQASILKITANGTNTSPVLRGVWVNERILGRHPQPPPPGVPGVEPDIRGAQTLRQQLALHRDSDSCRACHNMIDPPGFALECFDPVGGFRDFYRTLGGGGERVDRKVEGRKVVYQQGLPVDASGTTPEGFAFSGFNDFREHVASDEDQIAEVVATKLLTFATGREMGFSDRQPIADIVERSRKSGHGIADLIVYITQSPLFRQK
ncbi:DUF1592 domain-containing protein [Stieleria varia]|uniref:Cytochrome c domain-containing protein n=1 Tax=Stieleria varia TaxID=2528005 RepID=A0A5C6A5B3_9BACT|nr:DUF1592 domain-containing protein [Stieleria varia]TWT94669.1 hypothetical protein Pla52n_54900 [Stieleria varia]